MRRASLTDNDAADESPNWSPDGARIAFASDREGEKIVFERIVLSVTSRELFTVNKDGTNKDRLTNDSANDEDADWGPRPRD